MADRPRTRQEIYERIQKTSKQEFILEDMVRLGFWPAQSQGPYDPADEIRRRGELQRELDRLREENRRLHNEQALIKELRKRRLAESRKKKQETKEHHERERKERAEAWQARKAREVLYLGEGVSGGLSERKSDEARLQRQGLPVLHTPEEVAAAMGLSVGALRFLAFSRKAAPVSHYVRFHLAKKTGGQRLISAPMPRLKRAQAWVLRQVLDPAGGQVHAAAHGFHPGRSIVSNAAPHVGKEVVFNADLQDFFPTVTYRRVKGLFRTLGYSESVATVLALLCSEPDVEEAELDGRRFFVALGERHLPQGAPTSPAITNLLCRRLDRQLSAVAARLGFTYTRYADDLTFSGDAVAARNLHPLQSELARLVAREGFVIHPGKTRVLRKGRRQEVTGVVVNRGLGVPRDVLRRFRATLYQVEKDGPQGKRWGSAPDVIAALLGFASYVNMVSPAKGGPLLQRAREVARRHNWKQIGRRKAPSPPPAPPSAQTPSSQTPATEGAKPKKKWWKLW